MGTTSKPRTVLAATAAGLVLCLTPLGLSGCSSPISTPDAGSNAGSTAASGPRAEDAAPATAQPASGSGGTGQTDASASERKVARTAQLTLAIDDPAESAKAVRTTAEGLGGYVMSENIVTEQKDGLYTEPSTITVAVPSAKLDEALDTLAKLGDLRNRVVNSVDVTTRVVDTEARVKTLRESIDRVRTLMDKAGSVADIARVEDELTQRQSQLESLLAEQAALADSVAMTPVTITLRPAVSVTEPNPLWQGLTAGWQALLTSLRILITVVAGLAPFAAVAALVWLPVRAWRRRTKTAGRPPAPDAAPTPTAPSESVTAQTDAAASGPSDLPSQKEQQTENPDA